MPKRKPAFEELLFSDRERTLDAMAKASAALAGPPPGSQFVNPQREEMAWNTPDPAVTMQHHALIAQSVLADPEIQKMLKDGDITPEHVEQEIKARQTLAVYPARANTYTIGNPQPEQQIKAADRLAGRLQRHQAKALDGSGWEPVTSQDQLPSGGM